MTAASPRRHTLLQQFVAAGHLRYWIITSWGIALATMIPLVWVVAWYALTMASGFLRGLADRRDPQLPKPVRISVATASCVAWAVAPLLAWFSGGPYGDTVASVLLCSGYFLVFTQMRAAPQEALIVSAPYSAATLIILASLWGKPEFWPVASTLPVLGIALLIKVLITQLKDSELQEVADSQLLLIHELEGARDKANAASEAKSNFLAVISHELRTPMNGVLGAAQLLSASDLSSRDMTYVNIIRGSGEGLLDLLNDLLDVSKMEAGRLELHPQEVSLADLCDRIVGPCRTQAEAKGLDLSVIQVDGLPGRVVADPLRVGQVVQNLLSNAIKFTEVGAVTLTIGGMKTEDGRTRLIFEVEDTGPGIGEEDQTKLFQPFQQLDNTSTRRFGGTGLGLTIARRIAREMEGDVTMRSRPGVGSVFTFTAVVEALAQVEEVIGDADSSAQEPTALRVLVVEDHPVNRAILQAWLTAQGHASTTANDGEEALAAAARERFDLILMDVNMPVMDGLTATRLLRAQRGQNASTPVVILSASARQQDHEVGMAAGADAYLNKPIDFAALTTLLTRLPDLPSSSSRTSAAA